MKPSALFTDYLFEVKHGSRLVILLQKLYTVAFSELPQSGNQAGSPFEGNLSISVPPVVVGMQRLFQPKQVVLSEDGVALSESIAQS